MRLPFFSRKPDGLSIMEAMDRHRKAVMAGEAKTLRNMIKAYRPVERLFRARLKEVERLISLAQAEGASPGYLLFEQVRWKSFLDQLETEVDRFSIQAERETSKAQLASGLTGSKHAETLMKIEVNIRRAFTQLPKAAIQTMVGALSDGSPLRELFEEFGVKARNTASRILISGIAAGDSPRQIAKELEETIEDLTKVRALKIARNESLRVLTTSQARTYEANSDVVEGMRIVSALDSRTCPLCWARHGTILKPGEPFHRHITCRCALAPVTAYSKKWAMGDEELASLPIAQQKKILGPARWDMWSKGEVKLDEIYTLGSDAKWGPTIGLKTITTLQKAKKPKGTYSAPVVSEGTRSVVKLRDQQGIVAR